MDLTGQPLPDGDVPGRFRRLAVEDGVPDLRVALAAHQRAESDDRSRPASDTRVEVEREGADG